MVQKKAHFIILKIAHPITNCNEKRYIIAFTAVYKPILMG
jgi:hypothetical protein